MVNKKFWATSFTLTGTIIGAGILGLPYVFSKSGFLVGLFWILFLGFIMILTNLFLAETILRTKGTHQLTGYAEKYLGKTGKKLMFFAMVFGIYSALLAYLVGEGSSLSQLLPGNINPLYLAISFWLLMTLLLHYGLNGLKKIETWGVIAIITIILGIFIYFLPQVQPSNLTTINKSNFFLPFGVTLFALLGFTSIPELAREISPTKKLLKKSIILGTAIPIILYILFSLIFVGVLGNNVEQVATLSFGNIINLLGMFTMLTSYFVLSFSLEDMFHFDLKKSKQTTFFWVSLFPLALYLITTNFKFTSFINILSVGGVVSGSLTGILILLMHQKARKKGNRKPEFKLKNSWLIITIISLIFILGTICEFLL